MITWNDKLVPNQIAQNRRFDRILIFVAPVWTAAVFGTCLYQSFWKGDLQNAYGTLLVAYVGCVIQFGAIKLDGVIQLWKLRQIPVIRVSVGEIRIGNEVILQTQIQRIEEERPKRRGRAFTILLVDGSTRRVYVPSNVPFDEVVAMLNTPRAGGGIQTAS